jgi:histidine triad (HIT) family protein
MEDCIFCQIVKGKIPCYKIYEDDNFLAFLDIYPYSPGHTMVIPKKHYRWVWDVENIGEYMEVCQKIAKHFQKILGKNLVFSAIFGRLVSHAHIHILPALNEDILSDNFSGIKRMNKLDNNKAGKMVEKLSLVK